jgi:uncharacterized protein
LDLPNNSFRNGLSAHRADSVLTLTGRWSKVGENVASIRRRNLCSDGIYVHLYDNSELDWHLENGVGLKVAHKTNYPWDGEVQLPVTPAQPSNFSFYLRIAGWAESAQLSVNGKAVSGAKPEEYLAIRGQWSPGDVVRLKMEMPVQVVEASPQVANDTGRVAIQRGPPVYCMEEIDQPDGVSIADLAVSPGPKPEAQFQCEFKNDLLGGVVVLRHTGVAYDRTASRNALYSRYRSHQVRSRRVPLAFIPYHAWSNRQQTAMRVWTPVFQA